MKKFDFKKYLIDLGCKYSRHDNRLDHEENDYYIFIDDDRFMLFDLGDESGWIEHVPSNENDPVMDLLKELLAKQKDAQLMRGNGISPFGSIDFTATAIKAETLTTAGLGIAFDGYVEISSPIAWYTRQCR